MWIIVNEAARAADVFVRFEIILRVSDASVGVGTGVGVFVSGYNRCDSGDGDGGDGGDRGDGGDGDDLPKCR